MRMQMQDVCDALCPCPCSHEPSYSFSGILMETGCMHKEWKGMIQAETLPVRCSSDVFLSNCMHHRLSRTHRPHTRINQAVLNYPQWLLLSSDEQSLIGLSYKPASR